MSVTIQDLLKIQENQICADCREDHVIAASMRFGVFLCENCSGVHSDSGEDVRNLSSSNNGTAWSISSLSAFIETGNNKRVNEKLEAELPDFYQRPWSNECPNPIRTSFFKDKYVNRCFIEGARESGLQKAFSSMQMSMTLQKKLRDNKKFMLRKFEIDVNRGIIQYFVNNNDPTPKEIIPLDRMNMFFINHTHWEMQSNVAIIQFHQDGIIRSIFVRTIDCKPIVDFYNNIRFGKQYIIRMNQAGMGMKPEDISEHLTFSILLAGFLYKTGPKSNSIGSPWRKRWFLLIDHSLYYYDNPDDAVAKGEIQITFDQHKSNIYEGLPMGWKAAPNTPYCFYYKSPDREYVMASDTRDTIDQWIKAIDIVTKTPYSPYKKYSTNVNSGSVST